MKVCHIISGDLWAGAEVMAYHLLKGLKKCDKLALSAILLNEGRLAKEVRNLGIPVHVVDESKKSFHRILLTIRRILSKESPDVIHSHRYKENILTYLSSIFIGCKPKLIATLHGLREMHGGNISLRDHLISKCNLFVLFRAFQGLVGVSQDIQEAYVKQYGFREDCVTVIHNGIQVPEITPKSERGVTFVIGSSGRLFPIKDYPFMIEIARAIQERAEHVRFQLAGDGPERPKLQTLIERNGLNGTFELKGHFEDVSAFYRGVDLYLNTSSHEGIPMSVLEAMAHGLPVVAPNVGGLREIIDDSIQGYLVSERNPKVFAERCLLLYEDKALRQRMSQAAREKIAQAFSMEQMVKKYFDLYVRIT